MHYKSYSSFWFLKIQIVSLFSIVNRNANYAEICRVGNLEADFQQVPLVQFFWNFHSVAVKPQKNLKKKKKKKKISKEM